jgi:hypothetical protein
MHTTDIGSTNCSAARAGIRRLELRVVPFGTCFEPFDLTRFAPG